MSARKPGSLIIAPSSKPGNGTLWRDIHSIDGPYSPAYVGEAIESEAILFAAAPDLLAALVNARMSLNYELLCREAAGEEHAVNTSLLRDRCEQARAAIARAQGGAK